MDEQKSPSKSEASAAEAAAIRRRWITLGETVAIVAVLISGLTLWLNWSELRGNDAQRTAERHDEAAKAATLTLTAARAEKGARLDLKPASSDQTVQQQRILFPSALGVDPVQTTGEARIEASWFDGALKRAREKAGLPDDSRGDERLPVVIETRFLADGTTHSDRALYDVGYTIKGEFLSGHTLGLRGLSLVKRLDEKDIAALDSRWKRMAPAKAN
jgi:hypothetical protein